MNTIAHYNPIRSHGWKVAKHQGKGAAFALFKLADVTLALPSSTRRIATMILSVILGAALLFLVYALLGEIASTFALAFPAVATPSKSGTTEKKPAKIREMEANLKALAKELEQGQLEMTAGPISQERGEELEAKAKEMEELQGHLDRYNRIAGIVSESKKVDKVTLPGEEGGRRRVVHTTPGHLFVASDAFKMYRAQGKQGWSANVDVGARMGKSVKLVGDEAIAFERKAFDPATLSDLGDDAIIEVDRDRELIRYEEPEILTIRDVLNVVPTTSDTIRYVKHTLTERAAASQSSRGGLKPFLKVTFEPTDVGTQTIAVLSKVTEQDIDDAPRLVGYINGEMTLDVRVEEERQLLWGTGTNGQLKGLFHADHAVPEFDRSAPTDTLIDTIRKMRTDLRKLRVAPSFVTVDPLDWEDIELSKGTDERYIWGLITDLRGPRIWSLRVVESDAMTHPDTGERRLLMGDGVRGATIYDRNAIRLAVGFMDDDFGRNLRTLRAEERLALAVKRAFAFTFVTTAEAAS